MLTQIVDCIIILAFLGLIIALVAIVWAMLNLKNSVVANAKRLYERPSRSFKNLAAAGRGIVIQEQVRIDAASKRVKAATDLVLDTANDLNTAVETIRDIDWEPIFAAATGAARFMSAAAGVARAASTQSPGSPD